MITEDTRRILDRLEVIEQLLRRAEIRRRMDRDFASVGHLWPATVEYIKKAGFADELGYSVD